MSFRNPVIEREEGEYWAIMPHKYSLHGDRYIGPYRNVDDALEVANLTYAETDIVKGGGGYYIYVRPGFHLHGTPEIGPFDSKRYASAVLRKVHNPSRQSALTREEQEWVADCSRELGAPVPRIRVDSSTHDIAYGNGTILLGKEFLKLKPNTFERRKRLLHELLHHGPGFVHSDRERSIGYYSKPERDIFTRKATKVLEAKIKRNNPEQHITNLAIVGAVLLAGLYFWNRKSST